MFFVSFLKYVRGYLLVYLSGYAPERFLNMCGKRDILIWNLKATQDGYLFCISVDAYKTLRPILKKTKTKAIIKKRIGLPFYFHRYRKHKMFFFGILLFWLLLYRVSGYIWNIEVIGNSYLSEDMVLSFLKDEKSDFGTPKKKINCVELEEKLRTSFPEVIWASVKIYGTKMTIELQESLLSEEFYQSNDNQILDIIAKKDGVITDIITRQGTPLITKGMEVKKGDVLVSGELAIYSDYNETCEYIYESSDADIFAEVSYEYTDKITQTYLDKVYLDEQNKCFYMQIGDIILQNPLKKVPEGLFDCSIFNKQLCFGKNFYLPIFFKTIIYKPYKLEEKQYDEIEIKELANKHFLQYLQNLEEKGIQITQKNVMIKKVGYSYFVTGNIKAIESIVDYQPTIIRNTDYAEGNIEDEFN